MASIAPIAARTPVTHQIADGVVGNRHLGYLFSFKGTNWTMLTSIDLSAIRSHIIRVLTPHASRLEDLSEANKVKLINKLVGPGIAEGILVDVAAGTNMNYTGLTKACYLATKLLKGNALWGVMGWGGSCRGEESASSSWLGSVCRVDDIGEYRTDPHSYMPPMLYLDKSLLPTREKVGELVNSTLIELAREESSARELASALAILSVSEARS